MADSDDLDLDKQSVAKLIEKVPNTELHDALRVVHKHLSDSTSEDHNEANWGLFDDADTSYGLIFGIYRY